MVGEAVRSWIEDLIVQNLDSFYVLKHLDTSYTIVSSIWIILEAFCEDSLRLVGDESSLLHAAWCVVSLHQRLLVRQ